MAVADITSSSAWLRSIVAMFAAQGVDAGDLFREAGVDAARLKHAHERFETGEISRLWAAAVRQSGRANLGLDRQVARRHAKFDIAMQAMWHGPTLADGLVGLSKYLHLINDASMFDVELDHQGGWLALSHSTPQSRAPRQRVEYGMLALLTLCQKVTRHAMNPLAVEFVFPEPADYHAYRMAFQCPLRFGQQRSRMKLAGQDLALPLHRSAESLAALQERVIEDRLERFAQARTTYRAGEEIIRRLHLGEPDRQDIARSLGLAATDLERRLKTEGQSYAELLEGVRKELAAHYLALHNLPLAQVAGLLGWDSPADLGKACRRWFGQSPGDYRLRVREAGH